MKPAPAYRIRNLAHKYDGKAVLEIPFLEIASGEICALIGPNGSGKTTLLHILAFLLTPSSGSLSFRGTEIRWDGGQRGLRRQVTLIHQKPVLFSTTVWNNVAYGLRAAGLPAREIKAKVDAALENLEIRDLAPMHAGKLSGGEAQRVVLARGLVLETPVILLDEPTSFLDDAVRPLLFDKLHRANRDRRTTVVLATHDTRSVASLAHRVVRMEAGRIEEEIVECGGMPPLSSCGAEASGGAFD